MFEEVGREGTKAIRVPGVVVIKVRRSQPESCEGTFALSPEEMLKMKTDVKVAKEEI